MSDQKQPYPAGTRLIYVGIEVSEIGALGTAMSDFVTSGTLMEVDGEPFRIRRPMQRVNWDADGPYYTSLHNLRPFRDPDADSINTDHSISLVERCES